MNLIFNFTEDFPELLIKKSNKKIFLNTKNVGNLIEIETQKIYLRIYGFNILKKVHTNWYFKPTHIEDGIFKLKTPSISYTEIANKFLIDKVITPSRRNNKLFTILKQN